METLFQNALGITAPWSIQSIKFDAEKNRLDINIDFKRGATFTDSVEDDSQKKSDKAYDTVSKTWRHLNFIQHDCYLHASSGNR